jgi:hypothetical protein
MKIAQFRIPGETIRKHALRPDIRALFNMFVVVGLSYDFSTDTYVYHVAAPFLDEVDLGCEIPEITGEGTYCEAVHEVSVKIIGQGGKVLEEAVVDWDGPRPT